jgi:hypothetical protein
MAGEPREGVMKPSFPKSVPKRELGNEFKLVPV